MKDSVFRLQDKSVLIYGDFNGLNQALIRDFTAQGADVGFLIAQTPAVGRYLENVNDARNVHPEFGRAAQIDAIIKDKSSAFEAVSRMAEIFGRVDIVIDAKMPSFSSEPPGFTASQLLLEEVAPFFRNKKRGRVVFVREDDSASMVLPEGLSKFLSDDFFPWTRSLCAQWPSPSYGINTVTVGLNEDFILKKFPQSKSIRSALETLQKDDPKLQLVDAGEITSAIMFLASQAASGVSGQTLRVTRQT